MYHQCAILTETFTTFRTLKRLLLRVNISNGRANEIVLVKKKKYSKDKKVCFLFLKKKFYKLTYDLLNDLDDGMPYCRCHTSMVVRRCAFFRESINYMIL